MFLECTNGTFVAISQIARIKPSSDWKSSIIEMIDGETYSVNKSVAEINIFAAPIIPATPGYEVLIWRDNDHYSRDPVIAWRMDNPEAPKPLVYEFNINEETFRADFMRDTNKSHAVLYPNGKVVRAGSCEYDNLDAWIADQREKELQRKKKAQV